VRPRSAVPEDAAAIARIYNGSIEERVATFETRPRTAEEILSWFGGRHPVVVVEEGGEILAFAATSEYRLRGCYAGVAEFSVYADRGARGRGAGGMAMGALIPAAERAASGSWSRASLSRTRRAGGCSARRAFARSGSTRSTPGSTAPGGTS
jgi:phosphinothricin acetyltransferase